jgi:flagellar biosynthetic protein FliR
MSWLQALSALTGQAEQVLWAGFVVFLRAGAVMALLPGFGEQTIPARIRLVLALAFTGVVMPAVAAGLPPPGARLAPVLAGEVAVGLMLGVALRLLVHALQFAGSIAAQATTLSQVIPTGGPEPQPAIGQVLVMAGLALAMASGLHVRAAEAMILSYQAFPAGQLPAAADVAGWGIARVGQAFALGLALAMPFVLGSVLYNVALGVINRAMPMLMVSLIGAPAQSLGGLILLAIAAPIGLAVWLSVLGGVLEQPFGIPK